MQEVFVTNKQEFLNETFPFEDPPQLTDKRYCLHCGQVITVGNYKVFIDDIDSELICCPNAPECDGTAIDWMPEDFKQ